MVLGSRLMFGNVRMAVPNFGFRHQRFLVLGQARQLFFFLSFSSTCK